jgi:hypothetical protein
MSFAQDLQIDWFKLHKVDSEQPASLSMEWLEYVQYQCCLDIDVTTDVKQHQLDDALFGLIFFFWPWLEDEA